MSHIKEFNYLYRATDKAAEMDFLDFIKNGVLIVAEEKNDIVGFVSGEPTLGGFILLDALTVKKQYRNKGIGKKLMKKLFGESKKFGMQKIYLLAPKFNKSSIKFYESLGLKRGNLCYEFSGKIKQQHL